MNCPECKAVVDLDSAEHIYDGEIVHCCGCDAELEVIFLADGGIALEEALLDEDELDDEDFEADGIVWDEEEDEQG